MLPGLRHTVIATVLVLTATSPAAAESPTATEIEKAIEQLADDDFRVREAASNLLWKAGAKARAALEAAAKSDDAERAQRATSILARVRLGITPDTPPDVVKLLHQFRDGSSSVRRRVIQQLSRAGKIDTVVALLRHETDDAARRSLVVAIRSDITAVLQVLLAEGRLDEAEQYLELLAQDGSSSDNLSVYLALRGRADARIEQLRAATELSASNTDRLLLASLLKTKGDLAGARAVVSELPKTDLKRRVLLESVMLAQHDWKAVSSLRAERDPKARRSIDDLSLDAAYLRLSGMDTEFERAVEAIKLRAKSKSNETWYCAEALLLTGRQSDGIELLKKRGTRGPFRLLVAQGRYREAFELVGIKLPIGDDPATPHVPVKPGSTADGTAKEKFYTGVLVAKTMYQLGMKKQALQLFTNTDEALERSGRAISEKSMLKRHMIEQLMKLGLEDLAIEQAAVAIVRGPAVKLLGRDPKASAARKTAETNNILRSLFGTRSVIAVTCWMRLRTKRPKEPMEETLARVRRLVMPKAEELSDDAEFKLFRDDIDAVLGSPDEKQDDTTTVAWNEALGELCVIRNLAAPARERFEKVAAIKPAGKTLTQVGDLYVAEKNWKKAAELYKKALDAKYKPTLTRFLYGWTLKQAGEVKEGEEQMQLARLLPLADLAKRYELYKGLDDRKLRTLAVEERRLVARLGSIHSWHASNAAKELGNDLSKTDPLRAADLWQRSALSVLRTNSAFLDETAYLRLPHTIHKVRARGLLEAGEHDDAVREMWLAQQALPGDIDLALDMIPRLRKAKLDKAADELFEKIYAVNHQVTKDFPSSAHHHNTAAWLAARCERRPEDALKHAEAAVKLAPDRAAYLDTLAEVHFVRGDKQKAIELARRCIKMDPRSKHYAEQLERFEK